jgi:hypothetical protein
MATRALIGYLDTDGVTRLTTTYNHYDGYPSNLGTALENFFNSDTLAKDIANYGYISYIDPKTGDIEAANQQKPKVITLPDNFNEAMMEIAEVIDSYGGDYGYIWDNENGEWITVKNNGIRGMAEDLEMELAHLKDKFAMMPERPDQTMEAYHVGDNKEVVTNEIKVDSIKSFNDVLNQALDQLKDQPEDTIETYKKSIANDVRLNGVEQYADYTTDDFIEDFNNYISDKMEIDESFIRQMKYKAGIIK